MNLKTFPCERQLDLMDCGAACLKTIAKYYGRYYSLQYFRNKCGLTREGISFLDLSYAAESIGLRSLSVKCGMADLMNKVPLPCIIHWNKSHFVVVYRIHKNKIYVSDPAKGLVSYSFTDFKKHWLGEEEKGPLMALEPQADFMQRDDEEKAERRKTFENLLAYFTPYQKSFAQLGLIMLIATILQGILPFIAKAVIDVGIQTRDLHFINLILIANIAIILSLSLSNMARDWILLHLSSRINIALISDYLIKLMQLPISFFETKLTGDILQRASDHERIRSFLMNNSLNVLFASITFLVFGIILLLFHPIIFYLFMAGSLLYIGWVLAFLKIRRKLDWEYFELVAKNQSYWVETIEGMQDIKINNHEKTRRWKWEAIQARLYRVNLKVLQVNNAQNTGAGFIDSLKNLLITFYCAKAVIAGQITFGVMISTQFIIGMLNGPVIQFIQFVIAAQAAQISFLRLNEIHQLENEDERCGNNHIQLPETKHLILDNISFQYGPNSPLVLKGIRLIIPEGKVTAIVGDSGSGKSTLIKLLLRLHQPSYGQILMNGTSINNINLRQWRERMGAVMQDGKLFNDTILNNIVMNEEQIDYEQLKFVVETANIAFDIEQLPLGYQTKIGELGQGLSGGQKQRILIARALYKKPDFLIFDEATNALDSINEQKIINALEGIFKGKTVVVIAHRLSTIRKADQIIVMQNGMIIEAGNHETLMELGGHYEKLVRSQVDLVASMSPSVVTANEI